ncbi:MAG: peptidoglycan-binding protein [Acidimicrobiia bacterium]
MSRALALVVVSLLLVGACSSDDASTADGSAAPAGTEESQRVSGLVFPDPTVRYLQQALHDLGYPVGGIDGLKGQSTIDAVRAFQSDNALEQTGTVDIETLRALSDASPEAQTEVVEAIQHVLAELGYYTALVDGIIGPASIQAVQGFQEAAGLPATGELDGETFELLLDTYDEDVTQAHIRALEESGVGGGAPDAPKAVPAGADPSEYLQQGDSGPEVEALQARLAALGYRPGTINGEFAAETASAVMAFQKAEGLQRDSIVGPQVLSSLEAPQAAGPESDEPGPRVEVDLDRQVMFAIDASGTVTTINVSTGSGREFQSAEEGKGIVVAHTPIGEYDVIRRIDGNREAPLGTLYRPLYFDGGWAIHGNPHVPGYPASHGCVRTADIDQDFVFELLEDGDPVVIYGSNPPLPDNADSGA